MAETGSTSTLVSELQALIDNNEGLSTHTEVGSTEMLVLFRLISQ